MQKIIFILKITIILSVICYGCVSKAITGNISEVRNDTVCLSKVCFKLYRNAPKSFVGDTVTFTPVKRSSKKINCKLIK